MLDETEIRIEKLVAGGEGLGRLEGLPLFVPRSAPGDFLRVRLTERHLDYGRAEIVEILEPGPGRRPDPVPELSRAGACDLQHLDDELQTRLKASAVRETLERLGGLRLPDDIEVVSGEPWHYRLRAQLHTELDPVTGGVRVGYYARGTNDVLPISRFPVLVPELEALLADLPGLLGEKPPKRIDLAAGEPGGGVSVSPLIPGLPSGEVTMTVGDITYGYDARTFFQGHRGLLPRLVEVVVGPWEGEAAYDLFAGVGLFTLPLARRYGKVVAVEADTNATRYARNNARRNKITNVEVVTKAVESWLATLPEGADRVLVDPPRAGLVAKVRQALLKSRPKRLTYVSCHPAALARDLRFLKEAYDLEKITLFDLFPQTGHMETVVQLTLRD
ncbi:MAG TPA: TRAM domain-containing protein [Thermoanaerobaculia bacterium]|nr:TRAM domain-containing protein [Thermoanaerobaculia bacterium]